jgi:hypothetical protein
VPQPRMISPMKGDESRPNEHQLRASVPLVAIRPMMAERDLILLCLYQRPRARRDGHEAIAHHWIRVSLLKFRTHLATGYGENADDEDCGA